MPAQVRWCLFQGGSKKAGGAEVRIGPLVYRRRLHVRTGVIYLRWFTCLFHMAGLAKGGCYEHAIRAHMPLACRTPTNPMPYDSRSACLWLGQAVDFPRGSAGYIQCGARVA
jgi:hypothetical protein